MDEKVGRPGLFLRLGGGLTASAVVAVLATGCAAGQHAQTVGQAPAIDGVAADSGQLSVRNAGIEAPSNGASYSKGSNALLQFVLINNGGNPAKLVSVSSPAAAAAVVSESGGTGSSGGDSTSTSASASSSGSGSASSSASSSTSTSNSASASPTSPISTSASSGRSSAASSASAGAAGAISLEPGASVQVGYEAAGPSVELTDLTQQLYPAQTVPVTFTFDNGASITANLSVRINGGGASGPTVSAATAAAE